MAKYYVRYIIFALPAILVSYLFNNSTTLSQILQWFFAFFMVFGWGINSGMAAYFYPQKVCAALLAYAGITGLVIFFLYNSEYNSRVYYFLKSIGGFISFQPLSIMVKSLIDFNIPQEIFVVGFLLLTCLFGIIVGLMQQRIHPNPYSPKMSR